MATRLLAFFYVALAAAQTPVPTYHNDNQRTGQYLSEILLTPANVKAGSFGKRLSRQVDGAVYAQPLYLPRVRITGKGLHDVVFIVTGHGSLYAFDADDNSGANAEPLWQVSFIDPSNGITAVPAGDIECYVIQPELGVIGTPVIDPGSGTLYLINETKESGDKYVFRLHALDVTTGAERQGSPVVVQPPGFVPLAHKQRGALLLANGVVYSPWGSNCDIGSYHGWIMAHDAATLKLTGVFNVTPDGKAASFWNAGAGPAADPEGNIFVVSANGDFDADSGGKNYGDSVVKLTAAPSLSPADYFTPFNQQYLDLNDVDLGSSGALLLPDTAGSSEHPHLVFTAGKEGRLYLLDRDHLGGAQSGTDTGALASLNVFAHSAFGMAAYFNGAVYIAPEFSPLCAFPVAGAVLAMKPLAQASNTTSGLGATPSISANADKNGIVWTLSDNAGGALRAYDASSLKLLYDSSAQSGDALGTFIEFSTPTIADGKVYVESYESFDVYGEIQSTPPVVAAVTNGASFTPDPIAPGSLISLFGSSLAPIRASAAPPLPLSLADVSVTINGLVAPLLYISPDQINAQVPFAISPGPATVVVRVGAALSQPFNITVRTTGPGVFADQQGQAAVLNANGSRNSPQSPAAVGATVSLFLTGQGQLKTPVEDGDAPPSGAIVHASAPVSVAIGDAPAVVGFAGLAPLYAGLAQINLKVPALATGSYPVIVTIGGVLSNSAQISISAP
jgi:uncharacterized protein (TIGR03437 family)